MLDSIQRQLSGLLSRNQNQREDYGLNLKSGDDHYRAYVGPPQEYDLIAALQVSLALASGLRETDTLCDVGCGSLRAGRMLIPFLRKGNYYGVEPERWLVEEGIDKELGQDIRQTKRPTFRFVSDFSLGEFGVEFDLVIAQSVFSHTFPDLLKLGMENIAGSIAPSGKLLATWNEASEEWGAPRLSNRSEVNENGWVRRGGHAYSWQEIELCLKEVGLVGRRIEWPHPRQKWFMAALPGAEEEINELASALSSPRLGWGKPFRK